MTYLYFMKSFPFDKIFFSYKIWMEFVQTSVPHPPPPLPCSNGGDMKPYLLAEASEDSSECTYHHQHYHSYCCRCSVHVNKPCSSLKIQLAFKVLTQALFLLTQALFPILFLHYSIQIFSLPKRILKIQCIRYNSTKSPKKTLFLIKFRVWH